jgi:hypothetical protein
MIKKPVHVDILVRYDPNGGRLLIYDVVSQLDNGKIHSQGDRAKLDIPIESLRGKGAEEGERAIGACVLASLDFYNAEKIGLRDYEEMLGGDDARLKSQSANADADAQYQLAMEHISVAMKKYSPKDIQKAETYLRWASAHGSLEANAYLKDQWERIKQHLQRKGTP